MARFSERIGANAIPKTIQLDDVDDELRNSLWNEIYIRFGGRWSALANFLAREFYKVPVDEVRNQYQWVRQRYFDASWDGVYDLVEYMVVNIDRIREPLYALQPQASDFLQSVNIILERELSGYRFVDGVLVPISDPSEVLAIEEAADSARGLGVSGAHEHIRSALTLLGLKPHPDYRNSIKESISAVEATVNAVAGTHGNGVAAALSTLRAKNIEVHEALSGAMRKLYGFTSDSDGVRHAILDQATVGFDEAKFMLVSCSAFVNFLIAKADAAGLLEKRV